MCDSSISPDRLTMSEPADDWISIAEAGALLNVSRPTLRSWMRRGLIASHGRRPTLLSRGDVLAQRRYPTGGHDVDAPPVREAFHSRQD
jgi:hypothetical protein